MLSRMLITFLFCINVQYASNFSSQQTTILSKSDTPAPLLSFLNSSSQILKVTPLVTRENHLLHVGEGSILHFSGGTIIGCRSTIPFSVEGQLQVLGTHVTFRDRDSICPIVISESIQNSVAASISLVSSRIENVPILSGQQETLISLGDFQSQDVHSCVFDNVTCIGVASQAPASSKVWKCIVKDSQINRCEESIYGGIVSGLTDMTRNLFECVNTSFTGCFRERNPSPNDGTCSESNNKNCTLVGASSSPEKGLYLNNTEKEYRFVDCLFNNTYSQNQHGGAIYMTGTASSYAKSLRVLRCSFNNCEGKATKSGDVRGGAVGAFYMETCYVTACNFTDCHTPYQSLPFDSLYHGGGLITMRIFALCSVSSCSFTNCNCGTQGGGFYPVILNYTCPEGFAMCSGCTFLSCTANGTHAGGSSSTSAAAGGKNGYGGGAFYWPESTQHVRECLYVSCYANLYGGGLRWDFETATEAAQSTGKFLFFRDNSARSSESSSSSYGSSTPGGHDISFDGTTSSVLDSFSFTFNNQSYRVNLNGNGNTAGSSKDAWLPYPVIKYLSASVTSESSDCSDMETPTCAKLATAYSKMRWSSSNSTLVLFLLSPVHTNDTEGLTLSNSYSTMISTYDWSGSRSLLEIGETFTAKADYLFNVLSGALTLLKVDVSVLTNWSDTSMISVSGGTLVFMDVKITSATDYEFQSAPILVTDEGSLAFSRTELSTFTMTNSPLISYTSLGSSSFSMCTIVDITRQEGDGGVFELSGDEPTSFSLTGVTMQNCKCKNGSGGAVYANCLESSVLKFDVLVFENCTASEYGGALHVVMEEGCSLTVTDTTFTNCEAKQGGGCYVDVNGQPTALHFESTTFSGNNYNQSLDGHDVGYGRTLFIVSERREYLGTDTSDFDSFVDESSAAEADVKIEDPEKYTVQLKHLFDSKKKFYVKSKDTSANGDGDDLHWCDNAEQPCATLDGAMKVATELYGVHNVTTFTIEQIGNTTDLDAETATVQVDAGYTITIQPHTEAVVERVVKQSYLNAFVVDNSSAVVTITKITFKLDSTTTFSSSLFVINAGSITLTDVAVQPTAEDETLVTVNAPLIELGAGVVATVTGLTVSRINGAALHGIITASLVMENCKFDTCGSHADYATVSLTAAESANVTLTKTTFTTCGSTTHGALSATVSETATLTLTECTFDTCQTVANEGVVFIDHSGSNTLIATGCTITNPSGTGAALYIKISGTGGVTYTSGKSASDEDIAAAISYVTTGYALEAKLTGSGGLTFSDCPFSSCTNGAVHANITGNGGLSFSSCDFSTCTATGTQGALFVTSSGSGAIAFDTCTFTGCTDTSSPVTSLYLDTSSSSQVTLSHCGFTASGSLKMVLGTSSSGSITVSTCTFTPTEETQQEPDTANSAVNGGGVYIDSAYGSGDITIADSTFTDCATHGALHVVLSSTRSLTVRNCSVSKCSSAVSHYAMYVESAGSGPVTLDNCTIKECTSHVSIVGNGSGSISITKIQCEGSDSSEYGAISATMSGSGSLTLSNSTFDDCLDVLELATSSTSSSSVEISNLTVSNSTKGVFDITASGAGSLTIKDSNFTDCTTTDAAVLSLVLSNNGSLNVSNCIATGCTSSTDRGVMYITASGTGAITISGCNFEPSSDATTAGGAISLQLYNEENEPAPGSDVKISGCTFTGCTKTTTTTDEHDETAESYQLNGGAIYLSTTGIGTVTLTGCTFNSCTCQGYGGGVYIYAGKNVSSEQFTFEALTFDPSCDDQQKRKTPTQEGGESVDYGNGIFISAPELSFFTSYTKWADLVPVAANYKVELDVVYSGQYGGTVVPLQHLIYQPLEAQQPHVYADPDGDDIRVTLIINNENTTKMTCGWIDLPCLRIQSAWENAYKPTDEEDTETTVSLVGTKTEYPKETTGIAVQDYKLSISSETDATLDISSFTSQVLLSIEGGRLSVENVSIQIQNGLKHAIEVGTGNATLTNLNIKVDAEMSGSLLSVGTGKLTLSTVTITSLNAASVTSAFSVISLSDPSDLSTPQLKCESDVTVSNFILTGSDPLISMSSPSQAEFTSTTFSNIIRSSGNGTVFNFDLDPNPEEDITFTGMTFTSCDCSTGYGGAVYLSLKRIPRSLTFTAVTFETCSAGMGLGKNLFISSLYDVTGLITNKDNFPVTTPYTEDELNDFWVEESWSATETGRQRVPFSASLLHFLFTPLEAAALGNTVDTAFVANHYTTGNPAGGVDTATCGWEDIPCLTLYSAHQHSKASKLSMAAGEHESETQSLELSSKTTIEGSAVEGSDPVTKKVTDISGDTVVAHYLITAEVTFDTLLFSLPTELTKSFVQATDGSLTLSSVSFEPQPSVSVSSLSASLILTTITTVIESCSFTSLQAAITTIKGAVLHSSITSDHSLTLRLRSGKTNKNTFTSCKGSSDYAGAIYISAAVSSQLIVQSTDFLPTGAASLPGEYIYIDAADQSTLFVRSNWKDTINRRSEAIRPYYWVNFVNAENRGLSVVDLLFPAGAAVYVAAGYEDVDNCGQSLNVNPCGTMFKAQTGSLSGTEYKARDFYLSCKSEVNTPLKEETNQIKFDAKELYTVSTHSTSKHNPVTKNCVAIELISLFKVNNALAGVDFASLIFAIPNPSPCLIEVTKGFATLTSITIKPDSEYTLERPLIIVADGSLTVDTCTFGNVKLASSATDYHAAVIDAVLTSTNEVIITSTTSTTTFMACKTASSAGKSGAIYFSTKVTDVTLQVQNTSFVDCDYIKDSTTVPMNVYIDCIDATKLIISESYWVNSGYNDAPPSFIVNEIETEPSQIGERTILKNVPVRNFLKPPKTEETVYCDPNYVDLSTCGWKELPCASLQKTLGQSANTKVTVVMASTTHDAETSMITLNGKNKEYTIGAASAAAKANDGTLIKKVESIPTTNSALFLIGCTVEFTGITFEINTMNKPLFYGQSGKLTLTGVKVNPASGTVTVSATSLLTVVDPPEGSDPVELVKLDSCTIESITIQSGGKGFIDISKSSSVTISGTVFSSLTHEGTEGTASIVRISLPEEANLTISQSSFSSCAVTSANAKTGAIYLDLALRPKHFVLSGCSFTACKYTSTAEGAPERNLYITCTNGIDLLYDTKQDNTKLFSFEQSADANIRYTFTDHLSSYSADDKDSYWVLESQRDVSGVSLYQLLHAPPESTTTVYVGPETRNVLNRNEDTAFGADTPNCGWPDIPCLSISKAQGSRTLTGTPVPTLEVLLLSPSANGKLSAETSQTVFDTKTTVKPKDAVVLTKPVGTLTADSLFKSQATVNIESLIFSISDSSLSKTLFEVISGGELNLTSVTVQPESGEVTISNPLVKLTGGTATIDKSTFKSFKGSFPCIQATVTDKLEVKDSSFIKCAQGLDVTVGSNGQFTSTGNKFTECQSSTVSGSAIKLDCSSTNALTVSGNTFTTCTGNNGGAIYADMKSTGTLSITNNEYDGCESVSGGALYVTVTSNGQFTSTGNKFTNCKSTQTGGAIYIDYSSTNPLSISGNTFKTCTGTLGGAVYAKMESTGTLTVTNNEYDGCQSTETESGGALYVSITSNGQFTSSGNKFSNGGGICGTFSSTNTWSMSNDAFENCKSESVYLDTKSTGAVTMSACVFTYTGDERGTAITTKQEAVNALKITGCNFTNCDGAVDSATGAGTLEISDSRFDSSSAATVGAVCVTVATGACKVTTSTFINCATGGALHVTVSAGQFSVSNTNFENCIAPAGGAIYTEYSSTNALTISGNTFKTCSGTTNGGAIYADMKSTGTLSVTNNEYTGCESASGGALYVTVTSNGQFTSIGNKFTNCKSTGTGGAIHGEFSSTNTWSVSNDVFANCTSESVYLDTKSTGAVTMSACVFTYPESARGTAITVTQEAKNALKITGCNFTNCDGAVDSATRAGTLEISDSRFEACESAKRSGGLNVEVTSGQLNITNSVFTNCKSTLESGNGGAVEVSLGSGKVYVVGTTFTDCTSTKNGGALDVSITSSGQLSVSSSNFTSCTGANGGGVYAAFTKSSSKLIFESVCFDDCSVTGYGGGMYLSCGNYLSTRSVSFSSVTVDTCTSSNEETNKGTGVFIQVSGSLSNFTKYDGWSNLIDLSGYDEQYDPVYTGQYSTGESGEKQYKRFPLQHLLFGPSKSPLYVDPTGTDAWSCGWEDLPCSVICTAQQRGNQVPEIQLAEGDHEAEYLTSEFTGSTIDYTVGPKAEADKVTTKLISSLSEPASGIFVVLAKSVTFNKIQFNIDPSSFVEYTPFYVSSGKLILESVSVSSSDSSSASLMAPLIKVKVDSQRASARANQQTEEGDATQEEEAAVSACLKSSNFTNLIMSTSFQTASTIVVENGTSSSIEIDGCEFTNCSSQASLAGGALYYMMTTDSKLVLKDIKTTTCQCNLETGRGGFMFLTVPDTDKTLITITNPTSFTNNNAKVGRDMFIVFPPLKDEGTQSRIQEVLDFKFEDLGDTLYDVENSAYGRPEYPAITAFEDIDLLPLLYHYEADTVVINTAGKDNLWCGAAEKACLTLVYGCKHFNESEAKTLAFGDGSSLGGELSMNGFGVKPYVAPAARMMNADDTASIPVTVDDAIVVVSTASNTIDNTINSTVFTFDDSFFGSKDVFITVETDAALTMNATSFTGYDIASTSKQVVTVLGTLTLTTCAFTGAATPAMTVEGTVTLSGCVFNGAAASSTAQTSSETTTSSETPTSTETASSTTAVSDEQPKEEQPSTEENAASSGETQSTETGGTGETGLRALSNADVTTNELCAWTGGYLKLIGSSAVGTLTGDTAFTNCSVGAVLLQGGATLTVDKAQFNQNSASLTEYDHVRRNIRCESSTVNVNSMTVDGSKPGSLWISTSNCTLDEATISSLRNKATPLFVPNITNVTATASSNQVVVSFSGDLIVPCNLYVYTSLSTWENVPLTGTPGETSAVFVFPSSFVKSFTIATTVYCQVEYKNDADNWNVTDQLTLKQPVIEKRSRGGINNSGVPWYVIPLIIVPFILFLIFLFCYLRKLLTREAYNPDEADSINKQIESSAAADQTEIPIAPAPISDEEFNAAADDDDDDAGEVDVAAAKAGSNLPSTVEGISTAPTHERVTLSTEASLFSRIHDPAEREQFYPAQWAADIGLKVASTCQYMIDILYPDRSTQPPPQQGPQLTHEQMKQILRNLSSHSMFYSDDGVLGLSTIPGTTQVPVSRDLLHGTAAFSQERLRFVSPELMHAPPADTRESVSAGVVYAVAMLLLEVATGWGVFDGSPAEKAAQLVMDGARPDLSAVALLNLNLAQVIAMGYSQAPQSRPSLQQMQAILKPLAPVRPDEEDLGDEDESKEEDSDADGDSSDDSDDVPPPPPRQPAPPAKKSTEMQPPPVPPKKAAAQTKASPFGAKPTTKQPPAPQSKSQSTLQPPRFQPRPPAKQQTASTRPLPGFRPSSSQ